MGFNYSIMHISGFQGDLVGYSAGVMVSVVVLQQRWFKTQFGLMQVKVPFQLLSQFINVLCRLIGDFQSSLWSIFEWVCQCAALQWTGSMYLWKAPVTNWTLLRTARIKGATKETLCLLLGPREKETVFLSSESRVDGINEHLSSNKRSSYSCSYI